MKRYKLNLSENPSFNSITELTNTSFNPNNYVENRMATEEQISQLYNRIVEQEQRRDMCCRDIIVWEARTQIVRLNNNNVQIVGSGSTQYNYFNAGGTIVSSWDENVNIGTMRRGLSYTVTFPIKWDDTLYYPITAERRSDISCAPVPYGAAGNKNNHHDYVQYRYLEDSSDIYGDYRCNTNSTNRSDFFVGNANSSTDQGSQRIIGYLVNSASYFGPFIKDVKSDGTITIKDTRRNTNYNIIRFYTQFTLNKCANGSLLSDKESEIFPNGVPEP